jgi:hypothetical protein
VAPPTTQRVQEPRRDREHRPNIPREHEQNQHHQLRNQNQNQHVDRNQHDYQSNRNGNQHNQQNRNNPNQRNSHQQPVTVTENNLPVDCILSEWSDWSPCSVSCGIGRQEKIREIMREAQNGGLPCPTKLFKRRRCSLAPCNLSLNFNV